MHRKIASATLMSLCMGLAACGGGGGSSYAPPPSGNPPAPAPVPSPTPTPTPTPTPPPADTTPPTVPGNVKATVQSANAILVSWDASTDDSGISGYRVFRNGGATAIATVAVTSYADSNLTANTNYSYTVEAVDNAATPNASSNSTAASARTLTPPDPANVKLAVQRVYAGLTLTAAHSMLRMPNDSSHWVILQQDGHVLSFVDTPDVTVTSNVLDITDRVVFRNVHGLLGLAFHPNYPTDPRAWVAYTHETAPGSGVILMRVSEFTTADGGATLNPASEQIVLEMAQPGGHNNGGHLLFGPDGFLYYGAGDGGNDDSDSSQAGNGQVTSNLLGKILRLDVSGMTGTRRYKIPADNPFAANALCNVDGTGTADCPEIFAWGFRNPWRWSFDRATGQLWLGDVGSHTREEVDLVVKGGNYGWRCFEGTLATGLNCGTTTTPMIPPVAEYDHTTGVAVTGGFVYHGTAIPNLVGQYLFGDYSSGYIWHIATDTAPTPMLTHADGWWSNLNIASFAQDTNGELYIVDVRTSGLYKLVSGS